MTVVTSSYACVTSSYVFTLGMEGVDGTSLDDLMFGDGDDALPGKYI